MRRLLVGFIIPACAIASLVFLLALFNTAPVNAFPVAAEAPAMEGLRAAVDDTAERQRRSRDRERLARRVPERKSAVRITEDHDVAVVPGVGTRHGDLAGLELTKRP